VGAAKGGVDAAAVILGSPYAEPARHWEAGPTLVAGRRPARDRATQTLRKQDTARRHGGYPGVTAITRKLLTRWAGGGRLFFAQREAIETVVYLQECAPLDPRLRDGAIPRMACSMATGSGKTAVMAALIAWNALNCRAYVRDPRFAPTCLVVAPNRMVRHRLAELSPARGAGSVYRVLDLLTPDEMVMLRRTRLAIHNWHALARRDLGEEFGVAASVVNRGAESDEVLARRVLGRTVRGRMLVLNDEAHHAHRSAQGGSATVWAEGLDALHAARHIGLCVDLTATPLDAGSGEPLTWVVSRFPLADAIEAGLVKVPQQPVAMPRLPWSKGASAILEAARPALATLVARNRQLAARWAREAEAGRRPPTPPVLAVVCRDVALAKAVHAHLRAEFPEILRLDSDALESGGSTQAQLMRWQGLTVGLAAWPGRSTPPEYARLAETLGLDPHVPPGRDVRAVVSVAMLAEGWDARNVAQLVGLRPFGSALLIEQVLGRGLRRSRPGAWGAEEAVDVCGIPLADLPVRPDPDRPEREVVVPPEALPEPVRAWRPIFSEPITFDARDLRSAWQATAGSPQARRYAAALSLVRSRPDAGPPHALFPAALAALQGLTLPPLPLR
jgi:type III restriction enzyme